jgi:hypothetical protein
MTRPGTRAGATVAALAVTAASGIAVAATASPAAGSPPQRAHTSLSIRVARPVTAPEAGDLVLGRLVARHHRVVGRVIYLESRAAGTTAWTRQARHLTGRHGRVAFEVAPAVTTRYRLAFRGNRFQRPSHSVAVMVRVRSRATSLVASQDSRSIEPGGSDRLHGLLTVNATPLGGAAVELHSRAANQTRFHLAGTTATAPDGTVTFPVTPTRNTHYFLLFRRTETAPAARSAIVTVHVRQPSSLSIRARLNRHGMEVISGDLRGGGHALARRLVSLQESPSGAGTWTTVGTQRTGRYGGVAFKELPPTAPEDYRLVFAGGVNFDGCRSPVATVTVSG